KGVRTVTAMEIFKTAAAYLSQSVEDSEDLAPFVLPWLNVLLAESLPTENGMREAEGEIALAKAPVLLTLNDTIPYHDEIACIALAYGLASDFCRDDDNDYRVSDFRARYVNALNEATRGTQNLVRDVY
ncbi:MAG: hypothetical protein RR825_08385, partial [Ruthenibacterium sp.]